MKRVQSVVQSRALLGVLVGSTQEYPLLCGCHLDTLFRVTLILQSDRNAVQLVAKLTEVLLFPACLVVLCGRWLQYGLYVGGVLANYLLDVLLDCLVRE